MGWVAQRMDSIPSSQIRRVLTQIVSLGVIVTSALIIWKGVMCVTGSESPVVVVLSGSMEPGFKRGDILFLQMNKDPIRAGEIVVFNVDGREIPIVHRVITVHERHGTGEVQILTKGDSNYDDDRVLYARGQLWLEQHHIMGRAVGMACHCVPSPNDVVQRHGRPGGSASTKPDAYGNKRIAIYEVLLVAFREFLLHSFRSRSLFFL
ncbi:signal peptidase [Musa troglodytarum]|uniref:Signal peptidase complex catalytic subunit SEC11 n=1 Tax=Musa troglodytarum TaxID=320322 RepID=A0A9E7H7M7_9LILI|nr:signal peptidase [Musa troglodytarum]